MEKKSFAAILGWAFLALGILVSVPWLTVALLALFQGRPAQPVPFVVVGLGLPLILGPFFLGRARPRLQEREPQLALVYMVLGGLWAVAGPLSALNLAYGHLLLAGGTTQPLALLLAGVLPPLVGLIYLGQTAVVWPVGRAAMRYRSGWIYMAVAIVQLVLGLVAWVQGQPLLLLSWLIQGSLMAMMAASLWEQKPLVMGSFLVALGLIMGLFFLPGTTGGEASTFVLNPTGGMPAWSVANAVFPSSPTLALFLSIAALVGAWQAVRTIRLARTGIGTLLVALAALFVVVVTVNFGLSAGILLLVVLGLVIGLAAWQILRTGQVNGVIGAILVLFILAFLIWASRNQEFNLTGMLGSTLEAATPIALGALSGIWCERSAVINIAIEGMMLAAAFTSVVAGSATKSPLLGLLVGMLTGALMAGLLAVLSIRFKVNQVIAGTAINIFATGATSFLGARLLSDRQDLNASPTFARVPIPVLSRIPVIGPVFFQNNMLIYLMLILVVVTHIVLFYTRWGLRSRSVGEHPRAADTLGIDVIRTRYINVLIGGLIAGIGGAYFTLGSVGRFDEVMTAGRGFIGLAAMIFGRWTPIGAFGSSLIFGFASSLQIKLGILQVPIPSHFLLMAPYLATIIVLAGVVGKASAPAADGEPYEKA